MPSPTDGSEPTPPAPSATELARAVDALRAGRLVAFPTETVYGLGADAASSSAVGHLYAVKGRPGGHPVIVHLASADQLEDWARSVPEPARILTAAFWPGPLTVVLPRTSRVPDEVTGGRDTVGLRVPDQPVALALLRAFGSGVAAPSANRFGRVSPTTADAVREELGDDVDVVLDGGPCTVGVESTIVELSGRDVTVLRVGGLPLEHLEDVLGRPVRRGQSGPSRAPGMLESHYAPDCRVEIVGADDLTARRAELEADGRRVEVLVPSRDAAADARLLYRRLREADALGADVVLAVLPVEEGLGAAIADRLRRAAGPRDPRRRDATGY